MEIHKHHRVPKHAGGTDEPDNIVVLSRYDHACAHLALYYRHSMVKDLCAYYMLKCEMEKFRSAYGHLGGKKVQLNRKQSGLTSYGLIPGSVRQRESASMGGKVTGPRNAASGHMSAIQKLSDCSAAGKLGAETNRKLGTNCFFDPEVHRAVATKGGEVQGKRNAESGHLTRIASAYWDDVKSGKKARIKRVFITNGIESKMIPIDDNIPEGWRRGRTI